MVFVLSKLLGLLLLPSNLLLLAGLAGLALMFTRRHRAGIRIASTSLIVFLLIGYLPVSDALSRILENRFPPWDASRGAPDGIIVLGGAVDPVLSLLRGTVALNKSAARVTAIARLARDYPKARIVYSSGNASLFGGPAEADHVIPLLESFGVSRGRVLLENRSRNTAENARFTKQLVKPKAGERWLLVTSAQHMPRAVGCFRRAGFPVEAYPVDWQTGPRFKFRLHASFVRGVSKTDDAVHEWLGLFGYWLAGRTSALLPGP